MSPLHFNPWNPHAAARRLRVYLLGAADYVQVLALQHRLVEEIGRGEPPALILCEHAPIVTVGRHGSSTHIDLDLQQPGQRWPLRWVNRGGGCWVQTPGQLAIYPLLPLQRLEVSVSEYRARLSRALQKVIVETGVSCVAAGSELCVGQRPVACFGSAVRDWITYFGAIVNVNPDLRPFRHVLTGDGHQPMTSMQRECRRPFRLSYLRERLAEEIGLEFGLDDALYFTSHALLGPRVITNALAASRS